MYKINKYLHVLNLFLFLNFTITVFVLCFYMWSKLLKLLNLWLPRLHYGVEQYFPESEHGTTAVNLGTQRSGQRGMQARAKLRQRYGDMAPLTGCRRFVKASFAVTMRCACCSFSVVGFVSRPASPTGRMYSCMLCFGPV